MTNKILVGAIIAAAVLLVYPSLITPEQSLAQTTDKSASTDAIAGTGLPCNTSSTTRAGSILTVEGINGQNGNPCAFEIKDWSFGVENPTTIGSATGGAGSGKAKFNEFTITKTADSASPVFFKNLATGVHYNTVKLTMRKAGGDPHTAGQPFLTYTFGTVFTTKIDWSGPGDEGPEEKITFVYGTLTVEYKTQKPDGTIGTSITNCFDVIRNVVC